MPWKRRLKRFAALVGIAATIVLVPLVLFQRYLLFPSYAIQDVSRADAPPDASIHWLESQHGKTEYWFLPAISSHRTHPVVFFAHGNGGVIDHYPDRLSFYRDAGFHVVLVEYPGYGRSTGSPSQETIVGTFVAVVDEVLARDDVDRSRVTYHGESIGGGVVAAATRMRPPHRLVLESTFTSIRDIAFDIFPPFWALVFDPFETADVVAAHDIPTIVLHGRRDNVVPFKHGEALAKLVGTTVYATDAQHLITWDAAYQKYVLGFVTARP